ncbi:MAG: Fic family protein [Coriobacteriales bacterium]|jgi:Fic family protein|nr:Fic family protein [Coriobacteriales bacterium]
MNESNATGDSPQLTLRQKALLLAIEQQAGGVSRDDLAGLLRGSFPASRATIIRDLNALQAQGLVQAAGKGPATRYRARAAGQLLSYFDLDAYFSYEADDRPLTEQSISGFLAQLSEHTLLNSEERAQLDATNDAFQARLSSREPDILRRERERFTVELAWRSSAMEGNTYSLLETEELLKTARGASGHASKEAQMILNHKDALDHVWSRREEFKRLGVDGVLAVHRLLVRDLGTGSGLRRQPVGITGTSYLPPASEGELREYLAEALRIANAKRHPVEAAIVASAMIAFLQPFSDGNKRTARLTGNAVLMAQGYAPLSYRSVRELAYKKAVLLTDEQHSLYWYKRLFLEQFESARQSYFL